MAQAVQRHALVDLSSVERAVEGAVELARGQVVHRVLPRKQPAAGQHLPLRLAFPPPGAQELEQCRREHGVAVALALALLDADHPALAVDVGHCQMNHLAGAQTGAVGDAECGLVLQAAGRLEQLGDLLNAQDHR